MTSDLHTSVAAAERDAFARLTDDELIAEVKRLAVHERRATVTLIRSLIEFDTRRLYLGEGCSSLYTYCTRVLYLSEDAAYNRIEATRTARRFPAVLEALDEGALTLTGVRLLGPHLSLDNWDAVLQAARHKTKAEIEQIIAALHPQPDVPSRIRRLPRRATRTLAAPVTFVSAAPLPGLRADCKSTRADCESTRAGGDSTRAAHTSRAAPPRRVVVAPLSPDRYKVQITITAATHQRLCHAQALLRHCVPDGDPAEIFDRALILLIERLERQRYAATTSPRIPPNSAVTPAPRSRHISAAVKREVWRRDGGQCAFVGRNGRCGERGFLEFHHVHPFADGGPATVGNIQLRCRAHNAYEAARVFETGPLDVVRERPSRYG